jgi:hypothetical protein
VWYALALKNKTARDKAYRDNWDKTPGQYFLAMTSRSKREGQDRKDKKRRIIQEGQDRKNL